MNDNQLFMTRKIFFLCFIFLCACVFLASAQEEPKEVIYSPPYFGPNALPVQDVGDGKIPEYTRFGFSTDYSFGYGDKTLAWQISGEIPLLPKYVSLKVWMMFHEFFWLTPEVCANAT